MEQGEMGMVTVSRNKMHIVNKVILRMTWIILFN